MNLAFLAVSLLSSSAPVTPPAATLRVDGDQSTFMVEVTGGLAAGYQIAIDCTEKCARPVHYREATGDAPLGLFSRDQNGLVFSTWSGGSAYRVRVWSVAGDTVRKVAEMSSRGRPDFLSDSHGWPMIQTYERIGSAAGLRRVRWTFVGGHFMRFKADGR
ncbi:hypothetical protein WSK_2385 [Novosphingobium sp. Rr 2-17]|uniref:hypothetical protein n=1 Tax=Novosphingobium sp. Rr 2-17 TaxID=555793 RepID=UPI000269A510|nr:hypothetical protein [Novosphingobium sp. Rr 2-17]EIZ78842.1 hypothetical protein WSK_2385 [Novosphingobium sp. Rr 2-17]